VACRNLAPGSIPRSGGARPGPRPAGPRGWPELGRPARRPGRGFVQRDPAKEGVNWYAYVGNRPTMGADPEGLFKLCWTKWKLNRRSWVHLEKWTYVMTCEVEALGGYAVAHLFVRFNTHVTVLELLTRKHCIESTRCGTTHHTTTPWKKIREDGVPFIVEG